jgi:hypothetical protein
MSKRDALDDFLGQAEAAFHYLTREEGFLGPERRPDGLAYHSPSLEVDVLLDQREQAVVTLIRALVDDLHLRAELSCLYAKASLGAVQDVKRTARTTHTMQRSLASQSEALKRLLPVLAGSSKDGLLKACHAR